MSIGFPSLFFPENKTKKKFTKKKKMFIYGVRDHAI